jgi:hypothetical protein
MLVVRSIRLSKAFAVDGKPVALQRALQSNGLSPIGFRNVSISWLAD